MTTTTCDCIGYT